MAQKNPGFTEFGAPVPDDEYQYFKDQFPQYGAVKWFINQALISFNQKVRENPTAKEQIDRSIEQMIDMNRAIRAVGAGESAPAAD